MDIAVTHTHTYKCWKTIWTLLLKKDLGNPKIDRLWTIHLYKADYNLLLKWFSSKGFILRSKKAWCITNNQGGGRTSQSTIDLAITKVLSYKVADILHLCVIIVDNDATVCFDRMIEAQNNLACLQHGANPHYIKLHAQTQHKLKYYLKHKYRISEDHNTHTTAQPWYGMGQGAGNACNRWVIGTDSMATAYTTGAHGWTIPSPYQLDSHKQDLKAFINDINLFIDKTENTTEANFLTTAQANIDQWHGLLHATGGELNNKKCFWSDFQLKYNPNNTPSLCEWTPTDPQLYLTNTNGTKDILKTTQPNDGIWHLGMHISMNGNSHAETAILFKWCKLFQKVYTRCPLSCQEATVIYSTIYLPTITYPFPTTNMTQATLEKAQSMTTPFILSKMGYNKNMPKAVVYTPTSHGGLGLKLLHTEQGLQKVLQVLKHLRAKTTLSKLITTTIDAYQLQAGIPSHILIDTKPLLWMPDRWVTQLWEFLYSIEGTIQLANPWTIPKSRHQDHHLMQDFLTTNLPPKHLQILNNCRLFLQVTMLAEISNHKGTKLLDTNLTTSTHTPNLSSKSTSLLKWPNQPNLGRLAWMIWTKTLQQLYTKPGLTTQLRQPLGPWTPDAATIRMWHTHYNPNNKAISKTSPSQTPTLFIPEQITQSHIYYQNLSPLPQAQPGNFPVTIETQKHGFQVAHPLYPIPLHQNPEPPNTPLNLVMHIQTLLPDYAPKLWSMITHNPNTTATTLAKHI